MIACGFKHPLRHSVMLLLPIPDSFYEKGTLKPMLITDDFEVDYGFHPKGPGHFYSGDSSVGWECYLVVEHHRKYAEKLDWIE